MMLDEYFLDIVVRRIRDLENEVVNIKGKMYVAAPRF